ncbi:MAG: SppA protein [Zoogloeaceae bacterium]|uniref:SDH family Clp fold serine proteinase n=1 Tax=Denitromonas sp. TaxID=2734609 RepID=UPI001DFBA39B|nr:hypothetical protein [Rhodocyclaceae bacterium]MCP5222545.1 SppA protein [Zoogloeaceae bacterium]
MTKPDNLHTYAQENDCDIIVYAGPISRHGYDQLCSVIPTVRRTHCLFVLMTYGGDAHSGYRIARALSHNYPDPGRIRILVPHACKSAGTLICIGAHELIVADKGELGPLDVQVQKPDEMMQLTSGLDIIRGLSYLRDELLGSFREFLIDINQGSGLSTAIASEIASKLTIGMYNPIVGQIDPLKLGEMQAALTIALEYGKRLNERTKSLKSNALSRLTMQYPSHGFVIDRKEIRQLFKTVRAPETEPEQELCQICDNIRLDDGRLLVKCMVPEASAASDEGMQGEVDNCNSGVSDESRYEDGEASANEGTVRSIDGKPVEQSNNNYRDSDQGKPIDTKNEVA